MGFHVAPLSVLRLKKMSEFPGVPSCHTTNLLEPEAAAISSELLVVSVTAAAGSAATALLFKITNSEEIRRTESKMLHALLNSIRFTRHSQARSRLRLIYHRREQLLSLYSICWYIIELASTP